MIRATILLMAVLAAILPSLAMQGGFRSTKAPRKEDLIYYIFGSGVYLECGRGGGDNADVYAR